MTSVLADELTYALSIPINTTFYLAQRAWEMHDRRSALIGPSVSAPTLCGPGVIKPGSKCNPDYTRAIPCGQEVVQLTYSARSYVVDATPGRYARLLFLTPGGMPLI